MNTRALYILLAVQVFFGLVLLFIGGRSRDNRRAEYLEQSHRITSGAATEEDYVALAAKLPPFADAAQVRALFGVPLGSARTIVMNDVLQKDDKVPEKGEFWVYYPRTADAKPVDSTTVRALKGWQRCFVIEFGKAGMLTAKPKWVAHPLLKPPMNAEICE